MMPSNCLILFYKLKIHFLNIMFAYSLVVQSNIYSYFAKINLTDCIIYYLLDTSVYLRG